MLPIFIANWKMNLSDEEGLKLAKKIKRQIKKKQLNVVLCPSFISLFNVRKILFNSDIKLGAQNVFWMEKGAFTGEISVSMLKEVGCKYVVIGHSERRQYLLETDEMINKKVKIVLDKKIIPIICVGENLKQKKIKNKIITNQIVQALKDVRIKKDQKIIIAYEPIWAIGTGHSINQEELENTSKIINNIIVNLYSLNVAKNNFQIIYGGSVDSTNIRLFINQSIMNGVLVGGASLKIDEITKMIKSVISL